MDYFFWVSYPTLLLTDATDLLFICRESVSGRLTEITWESTSASAKLWGVLPSGGSSVCKTGNSGKTSCCGYQNWSSVTNPQTLSLHKHAFFHRKKERMITKKQEKYSDRLLFHATESSLVEATCLRNFDFEASETAAYGQGVFLSRWQIDCCSKAGDH